MFQKDSKTSDGSKTLRAARPAPNPQGQHNRASQLSNGSAYQTAQQFQPSTPTQMNCAGFLFRVPVQQQQWQQLCQMRQRHLSNPHSLSFGMWMELQQAVLANLSREIKHAMASFPDPQSFRPRANLTSPVIVNPSCCVQPQRTPLCSPNSCALMAVMRRFPNNGDDEKRAGERKALVIPSPEDRKISMAAKPAHHGFIPICGGSICTSGYDLAIHGGDDYYQQKIGPYGDPRLRDMIVMCADRMERDIRHNLRGDSNNPLMSAANIRNNSQRTRIRESCRAVRNVSEMWASRRRNMPHRPRHTPRVERVEFDYAPHYATIINDERSSPFDFRDDNAAEIRAVRVTQPDGLARVRDIFRSIENVRR